ncbi:Ctr copper transporter family-domain-containing protein [Kockovaella imperatae]|uniref:Copper transport protein n=1 Tax=Kockovaella imperatae TaxID=4999 RepID=A0A1Y1UAV3_9TREE|nr:Ctr copper transporter family-domain-containing protein [Kockovaella imperatae]ORX34636.1 Ctr copper transporter family-domain-containing protein [Kockovaella imperatae]
MEDHSGHKGHHMPMSDGPMCSMNMLWNSDIENVCVVFSSWHIKSSFTMFLSCMAIIVISVGYASLNKYIHSYDKILAYRLRHQQSAQGGQGSDARPTNLIPPNPSSYGVIDSTVSKMNGPMKLPMGSRLIRAGLYAISVALSFWLMLVAMTYNTYLFGSIVIGAFAGHMLYESELGASALLGSGSSKGLACH